MKIFGIFLIFFCVVNTSTSVTVPPAPTSSTPLTWSQFKAQLSEIFKNLNESSRPLIQIEIENLWKTSCRKIIQEMKGREFQLIEEIERTQDFFPAGLDGRIKDDVKFGLIAIVGNLKTCKK